jgi:hypothetical protein
MVEARWFRRAGPGIAAIGALAVIASTTTGAPPPPWDPAPCAGAPGPGSEPVGAWYRLDPILIDGVWAGQRLVLGRAGLDRPFRLDLDAESFASGPVGGTVLVGTDDGRTSTLSLLDLSGACRWALATSDDVIRHATLSSDGRSIAETRVDRRSRADLGVWQRPLDGRPASRILRPIDPDARFGRTWRTELAWSEDRRTLIVQTCGEVACRFRLVDEATGERRTVADPSLGDLVGLVDQRLVVHGACRGLPCPLLAVDQDGDPAVILHPDAGQAVIARDATGRSVVIYEIGADGHVLRSVAPDGRDPRPRDVAHDGRRLVAGAAWSGGAGEHASDWVLLGPGGRLPIDGTEHAFLRHVTDGRTVPFDEVLP